MGRNLSWAERELTDVSKGERFKFIIGAIGRLKLTTCRADLFRFLTNLAAIQVATKMCKSLKATKDVAS